MIEFQLRVCGGRLHPRFETEDLGAGVEAALFVLSELRPQADWWIALRNFQSGVRGFPTVHLQATGAGAFLQFFAAEEISPDGAEGWMTLTPSGKAPPGDPFCLLDDPGAETDGYFAFGPNRGIGFATGFLCPPDTVSTALRHMCAAPPKDWTAVGEWVNLGLI